MHTGALLACQYALIIMTSKQPIAIVIIIDSIMPVQLHDLQDDWSNGRLKHSY